MGTWQLSKAILLSLTLILFCTHVTANSSTDTKSVINDNEDTYDLDEDTNTSSITTSSYESTFTDTSTSSSAFSTESTPVEDNTTEMPCFIDSSLVCWKPWKLTLLCIATFAIGLLIGAGLTCCLNRRGSSESLTKGHSSQQELIDQRLTQPHEADQGHKNQIRTPVIQTEPETQRPVPSPSKTKATLPPSPQISKPLVTELQELMARSSESPSGGSRRQSGEIYLTILPDEGEGDVMAESAQAQGSAQGIKPTPMKRAGNKSDDEKLKSGSTPAGNENRNKEEPDGAKCAQLATVNGDGGEKGPFYHNTLHNDSAAATHGEKKPTSYIDMTPYHGEDSRHENTSDDVSPIDPHSHYVNAAMTKRANKSYLDMSQKKTEDAESAIDEEYSYVNVQR